MNIKPFNIAIAIGITFCMGVVCGQHNVQQDVPEPSYELGVEAENDVLPDVLIIKSIQPVYIEKAYCPDELKEFGSQEDLSKWQAQHYIGYQEGWDCVDYALELQRLALQDGYQMSVELVSIGGHKEINHAICSTWIGHECIFLDPQTTTSWLGAVKAE